MQGPQHSLDDHDERDQLSRKLSVSGLDAHSRKQPEPFRQDLDDYFCWPPRRASPQIRVLPPTPPPFQTQTQPGLHEWSTSQPHFVDSRNQIIRTMSPIYSHAKSSSNSAPLNHANSRGSSSDILRHFKMENVSSAMDTGTASDMPKISENPRSSAHSPQHAGKPLRPISRPSMPPAAFWRYAAEKQAGRASPGRLQSWQFNSDERKREPSICRYPIIPTRPETAVTRKKRVHHANDRAERRRSYENVRKGILDIDIYSDDILYSDFRDGWDWNGRRVEMQVQDSHVDRRNQSKRLVKKRQPRDMKPRCKSRTSSKWLRKEAHTRTVRPLAPPKHYGRSFTTDTT